MGPQQPTPPSARQRLLDEAQQALTNLDGVLTPLGAEAREKAMQLVTVVMLKMLQMVRAQVIRAADQSPT